jgi:uncharacterized membrane protein YbhN (UPF0104 family)
MLTATGLLLVAMPRLTGAPWGGTGDRVEDVPLPQLWQLAVVWALGLWAHTFVMRAALPGLGTRRALLLNLGGSSVSNVLPLGGAMGVALNYAMLRSWGYTRMQISVFATINNVVVVLAKIAVAMLGVVAVVLTSSATPGLLPSGHAWAVFAAAVSVTVVSVALIGVRVTGRFAVVGDAVRATWAHVRTVSRRGWQLITVGGLAYPALQALLLWLCLTSVGAQVTPVAALAAFAVERLATLVPLTPGGVGIAETAATGTLVAFGIDPAAAAGGVILFRIFSFLLEIPVGGIVALLWLSRLRRRSGADPDLARMVSG